MRGNSRGAAYALAGATVLLGMLTGCGSGSAGPPAEPPASGASVQTTGPVLVVGKSLGGHGLPNGPRLVASRQQHPRGGIQLHLYLERAGTELTDAHGGPIVPFVATDTPPTLRVATGCAPRTLIVRTASLAEGPRARWTVRERRYRVTRAGATAIGNRVLVRGLPTKQLAHRFPDVMHGSLLTGCTE